MSTNSKSPSRAKSRRLAKAVAQLCTITFALSVPSTSASHAGEIEPIPISATKPASEITKSSQPPEYQLLMIHARWCGPCQRVKRNVLPHLGVNYSDTGQDPIYLIDSGKSPQSIKQYSVKALPTFILRHREGDDWKSVRRTSGMLTAAGFRKTFPEVLDLNRVTSDSDTSAQAQIVTQTVSK